ncbi:uncharacterized protein TNIN_57681 [Trichonephila inaurata madagascariensis]|uniref:Uncharacterized protein n=1 Tax=Trichonephila inaurata madagascariensis TaxID=2747483 RepID=A0A8X6ID27_9ARAC|nr:uncharacterized protein TNIN_57681 [Trichonephila inaurata madagascariensis]
MLIGADIAGKLFTDRLTNLASGLTCLETMLGWTVIAKTDKTENSNSSLLVLSLHVHDVKISDLRTLDSLEKKEDNVKHNKSKTQELALEHFKKRLEEYQKVFNQWENHGIIEEINSDEINTKDLGVHYRPQKAVLKDNSTTKVQPVFDGSAEKYNSASKKDCVEKGQNLNEMIPAILNKFRWGGKSIEHTEEHTKTDKDNVQRTKLKILSIVHKIFDPIGFTCPVTLLPKLLLQESWKHKISENKGYDIVYGFEKYLNPDNLKEIAIPRRLIPDLDTSSSISLHVFCDASKLAYATFIYVRNETSKKEYN